MHPEQRDTRPIIAASLDTKLKQIPEKPGVYLMKDGQGHVIYIGKAKVLRNRVRSYFHDSNIHPKTQLLVAEIEDFDCIVTGSELEALILESNLIKKWQPRYNIRVKDDKAFPYIHITSHELFPRVMITRRFQKSDKGHFFGPYVPAKAVYQTLAVIKKVFQIAQCDLDLTKTYERSCLYHQIGQCSAPCTRAISEQAYRQSVKEVIKFLAGQRDDLITDFETRMWQAAEQEHYEVASRLRDRIAALHKISERQKIISGKFEEQDVIALKRLGPKALIQVFHVREGKVLGKSQQTLKALYEETDEELLSTFLTQFYRRDTIIPKEVILQEHIEEVAVVADWLSEKRGSRVTITVPQRGRKARLVDMVSENIAQALTFEFDRVAEEKAAAAQIAEVLDLPEPPNRIECYDISCINGVLAVGSMTVWQDGKLANNEYRHFKIKGEFSGPDDYRMLHEVLTRRFTGSLNSREQLPDLLMVDGGKGHLNVAVAVMEEVGLARTPLIGIAKGPERKRDDIYRPGQKNALNFNRAQEGLHLLARLRDESHRFAIEYHRKLRTQTNLSSVLDQIPGIGPKRKKGLLKHFGSLRRVKLASVEQLLEVQGIDRKTAEQLHALLRAPEWSELDSGLDSGLGDSGLGDSGLDSGLGETESDL